MLRFCGFDLELEVQVSLGDSAGSAVYAATDATGDHWLIVESPSEANELCWICTPVSARVVDLVAAGRASVTDAVRHSATGWVELIRVLDGHAVPDLRIRCSELAALPAVLAEPAS